MANDRQKKARQEAEKLKKLRAFVQQNHELQKLHALSAPEEVEKALKQADLPQEKKQEKK